MVELDRTRLVYALTIASQDSARQAVRSVSAYPPGRSIEILKTHEPLLQIKSYVLSVTDPHSQCEQDDNCSKDRADDGLDAVRAVSHVIPQ